MGIGEYKGDICTWKYMKDDGGPDRNRTGVRGFAGRCITTLPPGLNATPT